MAIFYPTTRVVCKKTRENISELGFLTQKANEIGIFSDFFQCRISDKEATIRAQQVFHDYPTIMPVSQIRTAVFGLISGFFPRLVIMLESRQS